VCVVGGGEDSELYIRNKSEVKLTAQRKPYQVRQHWHMPTFLS